MTIIKKADRQKYLSTRSAKELLALKKSSPLRIVGSEKESNPGEQSSPEKNVESSGHEPS